MNGRSVCLWFVVGCFWSAGWSFSWQSMVSQLSVDGHSISVMTKKAIVESLRARLQRNKKLKSIIFLLEKISKDEKEYFRVRESATQALRSLMVSPNIDYL